MLENSIWITESSSCLHYRLPDFAVDELAGSGLHGLGNPSEEGPYPVLTLTYGSGSDRRRPEYGEDTGIRTDSLDITAMVRGGGGITGLADFLTENGAVDPGRLARVSFVFDRSPRGDIFLDNIGFRQAQGGRGLE